MRPLTPKTRYAIIYGHNCGQSGRMIAEKLGCSKTAVYDVLKRFRETGSFTPKKNQVGLHSLTHQRDKNSKLLFKQMVKIVDSVQKKLLLFGQLVKSNLFLQLPYAVTLKRLDFVPVFPVANLQ
jgi:transposase